MIFQEWHEFVIYTRDSNRVRTRAERLDTSVAFHRGLDGDYLASPSNGAVIDLDEIVRGNDVFESMEVTDYGDVLIWTHQKVWLLLRRGMNEWEKLMYVPRHPPRDENPA